MNQKMLVHGQPALPPHPCAFCNGSFSAGTSDMLTLFVGNPRNSFMTLWVHRKCLADRLASPPKELDRVPAGDFLAENIPH
jgi:hypothetical protein